MSRLSRQWRRRLLAAAEEARESAYAPYSNFRVGAAVLTDQMKIVTGANVENASYGLTMCAERVAVFTAVAAGACKIQALALVTETGAPPCGACWQVLSEFVDEDFEIYMADAEGRWHSRPPDELWPLMFTRNDLGLVETCCNLKDSSPETWPNKKGGNPHDHHP